jgi:cell division protease FtsH
MALPGTDPVQKISIIPRGIAALGYTMQVPTEDRFLMRKTELENRIAVLLGGRAAEELIFGDTSTGAHNDLSRATDTARSMVKEYGMSEKLGQVYFAPKRQVQFLGQSPVDGGEYSDETARQIDEEVRRILDVQYAVAGGILKKNKPLLEKAAQQLLKDEVIAGPDLKALADEVSGFVPEKAAPAADSATEAIAA